jgi:branched-chain amino acid transport system substrate-binding protein
MDHHGGEGGIMTKGTRGALRWAAVVLGALLVATGCGRDDESATSTDGDGGVEASPGITDDTIKLGGSYPLSGPASAYGTIAKAVEACFDEVNANGGVESADGKTRTIEMISYDDGYEPPKIVSNAKRLVEQDKVFALFNPLGTPTNTAIVDYMNQQEVPHIYLATGASKWGADIEQYPWTIGWQPAYPTEAAIYGTYLQEQFPDGATVAVLFQNDDFGKDYLTGFESAIEGTNIEIIARESYQTTDPSAASQVVNLAQSGADVFFNVTTPKFAAQAIKELSQTNWEPLHLLSVVSASISSVLEPAGLENAEGIFSSQYLKEPSDPQWADDEGMQAYREAAEKYGDFNVEDPFGVFGFSVCQTMVQTLEQMDEPTRDSLMDAVRNIEAENTLLLPGIRVKTGPDDGFPIEAMQLVQFKDGEWVPEGDVIDYEGETPIPEE